MSDADEQQLLNAPYPLQWGNKALRFGLIDQGVKGEFVAAFKLTARQGFEDYLEMRYPSPRSMETSGKVEQEWAAFRDEWVAGGCRWGGGLARKWMKTEEGLRQLLSSMLSAGGTPLGEDDLRQMVLDEKAKGQTSTLSQIIELALWDSETPKANRPQTEKAKAPVVN